MRIIFNVKHHYAILLKSEDKFLTFLAKLVLKVKSSICSTIIKNQPLCCRNFSPFVAVIKV